jgi:hypothetical protein
MTHLCGRRKIIGSSLADAEMALNVEGCDAVISCLSGIRGQIAFYRLGMK